MASPFDHSSVAQVNELGYVGFITRGMGKNLVAVAVPISITIFATDALVGAKGDRAMH